MDKYSTLLGYYNKQLITIQKLYQELVNADLSIYEIRYVFAAKAQQLYTAIEDLLKQIAKAFENHIEDLSVSHKGLLIRLNTEVPKIRPAVLSDASFVLLDKIRSFRHFFRHAYNCELEESELHSLQQRLVQNFSLLQQDLDKFKSFVQALSIE